MAKINYKIRVSLLIIFTAIFCMLTVLMKTGYTAGFENAAYQEISQYINKELTNIMIFITNLGGTAVIVIISLILLILPVTRMTFGIPVAVNMIISSGLNSALKLLIARDRPDIFRLITETGYGFPSGHAMNNAALYTIVILLTFRLTKSKRIRLPVLIFGTAITFLIGVSRVYLGVHSACDVLAGWILGVAVALAADMACAAFRR